MRITSPRTPSSDDEQVRAAAKNRDRHAVLARQLHDGRGPRRRLRSVTSQSAGPPTLKVVNGARAALRSTRSSPRSLGEPAVERTHRCAPASATSRGAARPGRRPRARHELDPVARRELTGKRQVGGDHGGDLRIAARSSGDPPSAESGSRTEAPGAIRSVSRPRAFPSCRPCKDSAVKPVAHAIGLGRDRKSRRVK